MNADQIYKSFVETILKYGAAINTRNSETYSSIDLPTANFTSTPLITVRKTAWKKALREMEWFMSGDEKCPKDLQDWWAGQLNPRDYLVDGYSYQFRRSTYINYSDIRDEFDQIKHILSGIRNNPYSRRLILTTWNSGEMAEITLSNENPSTPTCCHNTCTQFFVRNGELHLKTYQRSADMLLGVPHNWIQTWALLLYFSYYTGYKPGTMQWTFGDAHIYKEQSHIEVVNSIFCLADTDIVREMPELVYRPENVQYDNNNVPIFKASDFKMQGEVPAPFITTKPKLI